MNNINPKQAVHYVQRDVPYKISYTLTSPAYGSLTCSTLRITISDTGEDYIEVEAGIADGTIPDVLTAPRYQLTIGLAFPDLDSYCPNMLDIELTARTLQQHADATRTLTLQSLEALIRDAGCDTSRAYDSTSDITESLREIITTTLPDQTLESDLTSPTPFLEGDDILQWSQQKNQWAIITEMCDGAEATCYHDGHHFRLEYKKTETSAPAFSIPLAMITDYRHTISRDNFANSVTVTYQNGSTGRIDNIDGDYAVSMIGRKTMYEEIPRDGTTQQATTRAAAQLTRSLSEGSKLTLILARLPLTLRPGSTIHAQTREGTWRGIIQTIEFDITQATTSITLINTEKEND